MPLKTTSTTTTMRRIKQCSANVDPNLTVLHELIAPDWILTVLAMDGNGGNGIDGDFDGGCHGSLLYSSVVSHRVQSPSGPATFATGPSEPEELSDTQSDR